jgi:repressor LexA
VAAGLPLEAIENRDELDLAALIFPAGLPQDTDAYFALKVQGDSMINEGIREGDCIIVRRKPEARAGEIVVASVDNEATLKRYYPFPDRIELHAANPLYGPIVLQRKDMGARQFRIEGVLTTVLRSLA